MIKSAYTGNVLTPHKDKDGYLRVKVWIPELKKTKGVFVHRAIAKAFLPNLDNKPCINHKDSNRQNNSLENLEWCTEKENYLHGREFGNIRVGKSGLENYKCKYSEDLIHKICLMLQKGLTQVSVAKELDVPKSLIYDIRSGTTWTEISKNYDIPPVNRNLKEPVVHDICRDLQEGCSDEYINTKYDLKDGVLRHIKSGNSWRKVSKHYKLD